MDEKRVKAGYRDAFGVFHEDSRDPETLAKEGLIQSLGEREVIFLTTAKD